jgi:hypothetical protein
MKQDLFNTPELLPQEVKDILAKYEEMGTSYDTCHKLIKDLEQVGYTCDYGLDGIPYELQKIKSNQMEKIKLKLLVSIDDWDKYAEMHGITIYEAEETQEHKKWYLNADKHLAKTLINNKMAELNN